MKKFALFFAFLLLGTSGAFAQSSKYDVNDDGDVNITDVIELVNIILGKQHEAVDLGLPSGTKWASCNVGATKPEEYGGYYAWGETEEKMVYDESTYKYYQDGEYVNIGQDISGTEYDVAHEKWGDNWCMPTKDDIKELIDNCTTEWTTLNGVNGMKFTSLRNGNSIFLPAAGSRTNGDLHFPGSFGDYWTSMPNGENFSNSRQFDSLNAFWHGSYRYTGHSVRPVEKTKTTKEPAEAIDLGLPSGTKWASCNVGATKPEEYGGYYAWGETEEKEVYSTATYQYATGEDTDGDGWYENLQYKNLGSDISGTYCDVAHVKWGGKWVMPSANEVKELIDNCTSEWTTLNGVNGMKFTSNINGNSIFLPASGWRWGDTFYSVGSYGNYWLSTQDPSYSYGAYGISSYSEGAISGSSEKFIGQSVRPVVRN
ncbi:MAG: hypothetical protein II576_09720 [Prevotella sp.]|nr:hypothetical protein [Prevotella sp.]